MKSYFKNLYNYQLVPFEKEIVLFCSRDYINEALNIRKDLNEEIVAKAFFASEIDSYIEDVANKILEIVMEQTEWFLDDKEKEAAYQAELDETITSIEETEGISFDELTTDDCLDFWGVETKEEVLDEIRIAADFRIKYALFCSYHNGLDLKAIDLFTPDAFNSDFLVNYIKKDLIVNKEIEL